MYKSVCKFDGERGEKSLSHCRSRCIDDLMNPKMDPADIKEFVVFEFLESAGPKLLKICQAVSRYFRSGRFAGGAFIIC